VSCKVSNEVRLGTQSADHSLITRLVVRCSALQCVAVILSELQCVAKSQVY